MKMTTQSLLKGTCLTALIICLLGISTLQSSAQCGVRISTARPNLCLPNAVVCIDTTTGRPPSTVTHWTVISGGGLDTVSIDSPVLIIDTIIHPGRVTVIMTNSLGCTVVDSSLVFMAAPSISVLPTYNPYDPCAAVLDTFIIQSSHPLNSATFRWYLNGTSVSTDSLLYAISYPGNNDKVWVAMTTNGACNARVTYSDTVIIHTLNYPNPAMEYIAQVPPAICAGMPDTLVALTSGLGNSTTYQWYNHNVAIPGATDSIYISSSLASFDTFQVKATTIIGCTAVNLSSLPTAIMTNAIPPSGAISLPAGSDACVHDDTIHISGADGAREIDWYSGSTLVGTTDLVSVVAGGSGHGSAANQFGSAAAGVFVTSDGSLYVCDQSNFRIQKFPAGSTSATNGVTVAGGNGQGSAANQLNGNCGIYVDSLGNIYIADQTNNRIQMFPAGSTSATNGITVAGGNGNGPAANQLGYPSSVGMDNAGNLYVTDVSNNRVQKFPPNSTSTTSGVTVAGGNGSGSGPNQFYSTINMYVTGSGDVYVSDFSNNRVQKFPAGSTSATNGITVAGIPGTVPIGLDAAPNRLSQPYTISVDKQDRLYVVDRRNFRVQRFPAGSVSGTNGTTVAGGGNYNYGNNVNGLFFSVNGLFVDDNENIYVSDPFNYLVQKWASPDHAYFTPATAGIYTASYSDGAHCPAPVSNPDTLSACLSDSVWPGDADHDGIADNNDLLPIGVAYGLNGYARPDQSIIWSAHYAQNWGLQFLDGTNAKHADCNGDAVIDANDTVAILQNFGLTHTKKNGPSPWRAGLPALKVVFSQDTVYTGDTLITNFYLDDSAASVPNLLGFAFTYNYDPTTVDSSFVKFGFVSSWLAGTTDQISLNRNFVSSGILKAAITRTDHMNRSGNGLIAQMFSRITTDNINGKDLSYYTNNGYISDIKAIDSAGNIIAMNAGQDSNQVAYTPTGIKAIDQNTGIMIYPNPAKNHVSVIADFSIPAVTICDMIGKTVLIKTGINKKVENIDLSNLANGAYMISVNTPQGPKETKLIISR